ncbi:MAG: tryptophan synthase subunit alpha [bacterium]
MSRYAAAFESLRARKEKAFIPFFVLGDPDYATSLEVIRAALRGGADMLELGIGFSDPMADGPTIQAADLRALKAGMTVARCFQLVREVRSFSDVPIGLLVYCNLIYRRGVERFFREASAAGVDGILAADVPVEEASPFLKAGERWGVDPIFMVTPATTPKRLEAILSCARGFLYMVALLGVTGARGSLHPAALKLLRRVRSHTDLPVCAGFGISRPEHVRTLARSGADGAIVGSAVVDILARNLSSKPRMVREVGSYVRRMKAETILRRGR